MSSPMTLRDLLAAGCERPWTVRRDEKGDSADYVVLDANNMWVALCGNAPNDAALICAAVNGAEALLQAAEERDALVDAICDAADDVLGMQELAPATELLGRIGSHAHEQRTRLVNAALRLDVAGVPDDSARTYDRESARVDVLAAEKQALLDEVERLKEFIAASEACAAGGVIGAVHDENRRLRAAFQKALDGLKETGSLSFSLSGCEWCHSLWPKLDGQTQEETEQFARRHAYACTSHPMRAELDALRAAKDTALRDLEAVRVSRDEWRDRYGADVALLRAAFAELREFTTELIGQQDDAEARRMDADRLAAIAKEGKL